MGTRIDLWLRRPGSSTLAFLRSQLDARATATTLLPSPQHAVFRSSTSRGDHISGAGDDDDNGPWKRRYYRSEQSEQDPELAKQKRAAAMEAVLRTTLGPDGISVTSGTRPDFKSLRQDSDFSSSTSDLVKRMVDSTMHGTDLKLWTALLQHVNRRDGLPGVIMVWKALRQHAIDLPTFGEEADILWPTFITSGIRKRRVQSGRSREAEDSLFVEVLQYAARLNDRSGTIYAKLYSTAIGTWLHINPFLAPKWHRYLAEHFGDDCIDLKALVNDCTTRAAFKAFKTIYLECGKHNLYDYFIPELLRRIGVEDTLKWHQLFIKNGDAPQPETFAMPLVQQLFDRDKDRSLPMVHRKPINSEDFVVPKDGISIDFPSLTRATMSALVGEVHGIKQREVSDSFAAKLFATRAFPLDMVVSGLGILGIDKLGPLALREMALRAGSATHLTTQLTTIRRLQIAISNSTYCQLLLKLAMDEAHDLYHILLGSDQHPDAFEDIKTQENLLGFFLEQGDLGSAQVTLAGLSLKGDLTQAKAWNRILQHYIRKGEYRLVAQTVEQMQGLDMVLTERTLTFMHRHLLPKRNPGKAPPDAMLEEYLGVPPLQFTTNMYKYTAERGVHVSPRLWIENMKRLGMLQKWDELERLAHWLAVFYQDWKRAVFTNERRAGRKVRANVTLRTIFSPTMREALIVWGFRSAVNRKLLFEREATNGSDCQPWARGLLLLKRLNKHGLHHFGQQTTPELVRQVVKLRMWILFGPGYSTKRINQEAKRHNRLSLAQYIQHANALWDGQLFDFDPKWYEPQNHPILLVALFGPQRRVSQKRGDKADVVAYARAIAGRRPMPAPFDRVGYRRRRIWEMSPFRIPERSKSQVGANMASKSKNAARHRLVPP